MLTGGPKAYESKALPWSGPSWLAASLMALKMPPPMVASPSCSAALLLSSLVAAAAAAAERVEEERKGAPPPLAPALASADPSPSGVCKTSPLPPEVSEPGPDAAEPGGADPKEERRRLSIDVLLRRRFLDDDKPVVVVASRAPFPTGPPAAAAPAAGPRGRATRSDWPPCFVWLVIEVWFGEGGGWK